MPNVKGKKYPYTKEGMAAANRARRGYKPGGSVQPSSSVKRRNEASKELFKLANPGLYSAEMLKKLKP